MARIKIFVGGIHGSGKGFLCEQLSSRLLGIHVSASKLLHWTEKTKLVDEVSSNQRALTKLIKDNIPGDYNYLIDKYFALCNEQSKCESVPLTTFETIGLNAIVVITCNPDTVRERLQVRDGESYLSRDLIELQELEKKNAIYISPKLGIPLYFFNTTRTFDINQLLTKIISMNQYTRNNILSPMLKVVIFRLDFTGLTNLENFVDKLKSSEYLQKRFGDMRMIPRQKMRVSFGTKDFEDGLLPYTESQRSVLYRFIDYKLNGCKNVNLDIEQDSITLSIDCDNAYAGSADYSDFMSWIILSLRTHDSYVSLKRLGVRKIDAQVLKDGETIEDYFNENYTVAKSWRGKPRKSKSIVTELIEIGDISINVTQHIDSNSEGREKLIYDVDAFLENEALVNVVNKSNIRDFLYNDIQDCMFELFISVASPKYLEQCKELKSKRNG